VASLLSLVVPHFHEMLRRIVRTKKAGAPLTPKEVEVINWLKRGKSTWDISEILKISERTVKFHVGNILKKLDAVNRTHAVAKAIDRGYVALD
jgi:DNA-binding CsgD family transcriptional regulator